MSPITVPAPAKLNLFLHITGQRDNGYHDLQTLFQFITLHDQLTFEPLQDDTIIVCNSKLSHKAAEHIHQEDNLIYKAAKALLPFRTNQTGVQIECDKQIPSGAGLGGGSSDAATTLLVLNELWNCQRTNDQLKEIGLKLGADVPIFIHGQAAFAEGVGENLTAVEVNEPWYVIIKPNAHISTAEIFSHPDLTRNTSPITISAALKQGGHNDCEKVVRKLYPDVDIAMNWLSQFSPAKLTGTGACVFAEFSEQQQADEIAKRYRQQGKAFEDSVYVAQGINDNPAHRALREQIDLANALS
ncbi:4-(cytidine 5'-diphospho)-2-C-methyl-D-erythritol kinase [Litoribacillus peritrichatus]|uniref:4-(cytidine 5'-diphospho)-2-C-methyl-D-erythritol kinase n=1 Tax=Litoribacillus peritrichatus TaxID=718191 RepID=UPI0031D6D140